LIGSTLPAGAGRAAQSGPSLFVAIVTLNLLEVSPRPAHLAFVVAAATTWGKSYPDGRQQVLAAGVDWRKCGFRSRPCSIQTGQYGPGIDRLLAALMSLGVGQARRLEEALRTRRWGLRCPHPG